MLTYLRIKDYKSFRDVEVHLKPLTILIGANASGKSNFLDALHFLQLAATHKSLGATFKEHRGLPFESVFWSNTGPKGEGRFHIEAWVELSPQVIEDVNKEIRQYRSNDSKKSQFIYHTHLCYRLTVEVDEIGAARVMEEELYPIRKDGQRKKRNAFLETKGGKIHLRIEGQAHPRYIDAGRDRTVLGYEDLYRPHYPHITAFKEELSRWAFFYLEPRVLMRKEEPKKETYLIGPQGQDIASFLNTLKHKEEKRFHALEKNLQILLPSVSGVEVSPDEEGFLHWYFVENGKRASSRILSEGALRVLGILSIVSAIKSNTLIGYEEPENGVHPHRLKDIADIFEKSVLDKNGKPYRQVILTTHSPKFPLHFDYRPNHPVCDILVVSKKEGVSKITPLEKFGDSFPMYKETTLEKALEEMEQVGIE